MVVGDLAQDADVIVIGAGPGGYVAAIRAAQLGRKVTLVEREELGGVCLHRGCIPSKAIISVAERFEGIKEASEMGISVENANLDIVKLMSWKDKIINKLRSGIAKLLEANKITVVKGEAFFNGPKRLRVINEDEAQTYNFQDVIIATGSRAKVLPKLAFDNKRILSAKGALSLQEVPDNLLVIGGGYIGLELGTAYAKLGSRVTILEGADKLLPDMDRPIVQVLQRKLKKLGINLITSALVQEGKVVGDKVKVSAKVKDEEQQFESDYALVVVGRDPNTSDLGLEQIGVQLDEYKFIKTNEKCQTNLPHIYAIGDCAGGPLLAHKASYEGKIAAEVIAGKTESIIDYRAMPYVIFCDPEVAYTGLTLEQAKSAGYDAVSSRFPFQANGRALSMDQPEGFVQVVAEKASKRLLGVQIVGAEAANLIAEAVLAIEMGATVEDLSLTIHPHPTLTEALIEAAEGITGLAIHTH